MERIAYSLVIPVYQNEGSVPDLLGVLTELDRRLAGRLEAVLVVDGATDQSFALLQEGLRGAAFTSRLVLLSRNFGSFAAIRAGLEAGSGPYFAVMSADLQEPPELVLEFYRLLEGRSADVVIGTRESRVEPGLGRWASDLYWRAYRRWVLAEMPLGGVDVFGCNQEFRDHLLRFVESHSSLISQLFWLGFRRTQVGYHRRANRYGPSGWTLAKRINYSMDGVFAFTDLPIRVLLLGGGVGISVSVLLGLITVGARLTGWIEVPGYAATLVSVTFFAALNLLGLGVVGSYAWRAYENTKRRPLAVPMRILDYPPAEAH